nr:hypothetical protein [Tanacetum cinerariifolium]
MEKRKVTGRATRKMKTKKCQRKWWFLGRQWRDEIRRALITNFVLKLEASSFFIYCMLQTATREKLEAMKLILDNIAYQENRGEGASESQEKDQATDDKPGKAIAKEYAPRKSAETPTATKKKGPFTVIRQENP